MSRDVNLNKLLSTIERVLSVQQDDMIPTFRDHERLLQHHQHDVDRLFDLLEMYVYVFARMMADLDTITASATTPTERRQAVFSALDRLQEEYMASVAVTSFVHHFHQDDHLS